MEVGIQAQRLLVVLPKALDRILCRELVHGARVLVDPAHERRTVLVVTDRTLNALHGVAVLPGNVTGGADQLAVGYAQWFETLVVVDEAELRPAHPQLVFSNTHAVAGRERVTPLMQQPV